MGVAVTVSVGVLVGVSVGVAVGVSVGVAVAVSVGVAVGVSVGVAVGVSVGVAVAVSVGVGVAVSVGVAVAVSVGVVVGVSLGSGVEVGVNGTQTPFWQSPPVQSRSVQQFPRGMQSDRSCSSMQHRSLFASQQSSPHAHLDAVPISRLCTRVVVAGDGYGIGPLCRCRRTVLPRYTSVPASGD